MRCGSGSGTNLEIFRGVTIDLLSPRHSAPPKTEAAHQTAKIISPQVLRSTIRVKSISLKARLLSSTRRYSEYRNMAQADAQYRLNDHVKPIHYALCVKTDLNATPDPLFEGTAEIDLSILEDTDQITFHAAPTLEILKVVYQTGSKSAEEIKSIERDEKFERCTLKINHKLSAGSEVKLGIVYKGILEGSMMGYYRSTYLVDGKKGFYGLTQFEPTAARRAFPCWDEPAIKATVQVSQITREGTTALTNTSEISQEPSDGKFPETSLLSANLLEGIGGKSESKDWVLTKFEPTPKISSYLVAWANGPFCSKESHYISPLTGKKIPLRVFATAEHAHQTQLLLDTTAKILPVYEKIFDIPYPLSKLDTLVASDFDAGAMENWGLITCRTSVGLFDDASGIAAQKRVVTVQSHEVAHQWFGNIVTMSWWQELWLNEAFATLMGELVIIAEVEPDWHAEDDFINAHLSRALNLDAKRSSHAVEVPCPNPEMINQIFDAISYSKGASILKMLANFVGNEKFLHGVSLYLKAHLYGNGTTKDLWAGIAKATGQDINKIMSNWTGKVGFPVLTVVEETDGIKISQKRFLSTGDPTPEEDETLWFVPLEIKVVDQSGKVTVKHDALDCQREAKVAIPSAQSTTYKLNADTCGVYRVCYPAERLEKLGKEISKPESTFSVADKMGLIQDAIVLAQAGYSSTSSALDILFPLGGERNYLVWSEITSALDSVSSILWEEDQQVIDGFAKFQRQLVSSLAEEIGFDTLPTDDQDRIQLRVLILGAAARADDPKVLSEIKSRFAKFIEDPNANKSVIPADLRTLVFHSAVNQGGEKEYEAVLKVYHNPSNPSDKIAAMVALCAPKLPQLISRTFDFILNGEVKQQDFMYFFAGLAKNRVSRRDMYKFVQDNLDELLVRFKGNFSIGRLIQYSFDRFTTEADRESVVEFFKDKDTSIYQSALAQGLDTVKSNASWLSRDKQIIIDWLKTKQFL
ncbi:hypothetical protein MJO28_000551 [Puccinia striiformis f. sp. tritici]|uniref:Aminopeptidase n=4 Tax=Puccinia striiformis TaxID=27350 RepID=A0A0L0W5N4_9BASI|nr:hypothetical protein Pst134EA_000685 [Puccinia striiformis f. sp. tritici]KAI9601100.1 hypothetical protein H4Q26_000899 [Puccinia striiformis f. sp. tritici PST-130]KNF06833.1 hypothetical protein PSTG_00145 [Puccinia striiformis f. sp. tritici PST-78]POV98320.1 hypothetical protein PSTT_14514 [Puccinia striiformis]KAH9466837.1 hypothetical protein Pst134EB_001889 [Puccinia striiformis f. sp. tritici]KAH9473603.1 hypothetical protein Pst134EA_000685 [Puccinia striiformis f. sp. tritici]